MSYRFRLNESLADSVSRIVCEQVDRAVVELTGENMDVPEAVHQVRKRCKKVRGMLRLIRGSSTASYSQENAWFRDLARGLSGARDSEAMLACLDRLHGAFSQDLEADAFQTLHHALAERRIAVREEASLSERVAETAMQLQDARLRVLGWRLEKSGFAAIETGLARTYRRARKALRIAYENPTPEHFHEWRKRVKYHWYHLRLLRQLWPEPMKGFAAEAKRLAELLGDDHDLAMLCETLAHDREALGGHDEIDALAGLAGRRQDQLRAEARSLGLRLFAEKPGNYCARVHSCWQAAECDAIRIAGLTGKSKAVC